MSRKSLPVTVDAVMLRTAWGALMDQNAIIGFNHFLQGCPPDAIVVVGLEDVVDSGRAIDMPHLPHESRVAVRGLGPGDDSLAFFDLAKVDWAAIVATLPDGRNAARRFGRQHPYAER